MWRAILPYLIGASIPVALLVAFLAWEFSLRSRLGGGLFRLPFLDGSSERKAQNLAPISPP
jgi:hypothetical protein